MIGGRPVPLIARIDTSNEKGSDSVLTIVQKEQNRSSTLISKSLFYFFFFFVLFEIYSFMYIGIAFIVPYIDFWIFSVNKEKYSVTEYSCHLKTTNIGFTIFFVGCFEMWLVAFAGASLWGARSNESTCFPWFYRGSNVSILSLPDMLTIQML